MKFLLMLLTLTTSRAFAQIEYIEERLTFNKMVAVHDLRCVVMPGKDSNSERRKFTELGNISFLIRQWN